MKMIRSMALIALMYSGVSAIAMEEYRPRMRTRSVANREALKLQLDQEIFRLDQVITALNQELVVQRAEAERLQHEIDDIHRRWEDFAPNAYDYNRVAVLTNENSRIQQEIENKENQLAQLNQQLQESYETLRQLNQ